MMKLVILDRDGVINFDSDEFIKSPQEWRPIEGSLEAIARLHHAGFHVVVATNQSGLGRGLFDLDALSAIHSKMQRAVENAGGKIAAIFFCPHTPEEDCQCRKPKPGLLEEIAERLNMKLNEAYMIGDSLRDIIAAQAVQAIPILVLTGNGRDTLKEHKEALTGVQVFDDLSAAVDEISKE